MTTTIRLISLSLLVVIISNCRISQHTEPPREIWSSYGECIGESVNKRKLCDYGIGTDSMISIMQNAFVPDTSGHIQIGNRFGQVAAVHLKDFIPKDSCELLTTFCQAAFLGEKVDRLLKTFGHPKQMDSWHKINNDFNQRQWSYTIGLSIRDYPGNCYGFEVKDDVIIRFHNCIRRLSH